MKFWARVRSDKICVHRLALAEAAGKVLAKATARYPKPSKEWQGIAALVHGVIIARAVDDGSLATNARAAADAPLATETRAAGGGATPDLVARGDAEGTSLSNQWSEFVDAVCITPLMMATSTLLLCFPHGLFIRWYSVYLSPVSIGCNHRLLLCAVH